MAPLPHAGDPPAKDRRWNPNVTSAGYLAIPVASRTLCVLEEWSFPVLRWKHLRLLRVHLGLPVCVPKAGHHEQEGERILVPTVQFSHGHSIAGLSSTRTEMC